MALGTYWLYTPASVTFPAIPQSLVGHTEAHTAFRCKLGDYCTNIVQRGCRLSEFRLPGKMKRTAPRKTVHAFQPISYADASLFVFATHHGFAVTIGSRTAKLLHAELPVFISIARIILSAQSASFFRLAEAKPFRGFQAAHHSDGPPLLAAESRPPQLYA